MKGNVLRRVLCFALAIFIAIPQGMTSYAADDFSILNENESDADFEIEASSESSSEAVTDSSSEEASYIEADDTADKVAEDSSEENTEDSSEEASEESSEELEEIDEPLLFPEEVEDNDIVGTPSDLPSNAVKVGEPAEMGSSVYGQIYKWTDKASEERLCLYIYGASGTIISNRVSSIAELKTYTDSITDLVVSDGITEIGSYVFYGCTNLGNVRLPEDIISIKGSAFQDCAFTEVVLPGSLKSIGGSAFKGCKNLKSITIPAKVDSMDYDIFSGCISLEEVTFSEGIKNIPNYALCIFDGKGYVERVNIPSTVTGIGKYAFYGQDQLITLDMNGADLTFIGEKAFYDCAFSSIEMPASLKTIGGSAFKGCKNLKSITIPAKVDSMDYDIFSGCISLEEVTFSEGIKNIPNYALCIFDGKGYVERVNIPSTVTGIGKYAFYGQNKLETVYYNGSEKDREAISIGGNNDPLLNATWIYVNATKGIELDPSSMVLYVDDLTTEASKKISVLATVTPANADLLDVTVSFANTTGNAVEAVRAGSRIDNVTPVNIQLTGEVGTADVTVKGASGISSTMTITVKDKDSVSAPYFKVNGVRVTGRKDLEDGDSVSVVSQTSGTQIFVGASEVAIRNAVSLNEATGRYVSNDPSVTLFTDELVAGEQILESKTLYVIAYKNGFKASVAASIELEYNHDNNLWGDITTEDMGQFDEDSDKIPSGLWIPEGLLTSEKLVYTGSKITPAVRVYYGNKLLTNAKDYTVSYRNNVKAADRNASNAPAVVINTKGNYAANSVSFGFTIRPLEITEDNSSVTVVTVPESKIANAIPKLKVKGKALKFGTDYTVEYTKTGTETAVFAPTQSGVYDILVKGIGNYSGSAFFGKAVQVTGQNAIKVTSLKITKPVTKTIPTDWDGEDQSVYAQNLTITFGNTDISEGVDLVYSKVKGAGSATVTVVGNGKPVMINGSERYVMGSKAMTFKIQGSVAMKNVNVSLPATSVVYSSEGNVLTGYTLKYNGKDLVENEDYTVSYSGNNKAGNATIKFTGLKEYEGTLSRKFKVQKRDITTATVLDAQGNMFISANESFTYVKGGVIPAVTLESIPSSAYKVTYSNNKAAKVYNAAKAPAVKITAKGNYTGSITRTFTIEKTDISDLKISAANVAVSASPKKYAQVPVIYDKNGAVLKAGADFDKKIAYEYADDCTVQQKIGKGRNARLEDVERFAGDKVNDKDILPVGTDIRLTVTGIGNYSGEVSTTYAVAAKKMSNLKFVVNNGNGYSYTGKAIRPSKSSITVMEKVNGIWKTLSAEEAAACYDIVAYENNVNKGTATIVINGKDNFAGSTKVKFRIEGKTATK